MSELAWLAESDLNALKDPFDPRSPADPPLCKFRVIYGLRMLASLLSTILDVPKNYSSDQSLPNINKYTFLMWELPKKLNSGLHLLQLKLTKNVSSDSAFAETGFIQPEKMVAGPLLFALKRRECMK